MYYIYVVEVTFVNSDCKSFVIKSHVSGIHAHPTEMRLPVISGQDQGLDLYAGTSRLLLGISRGHLLEHDSGDIYCNDVLVSYSTQQG